MSAAIEAHNLEKTYVTTKRGAGLGGAVKSIFKPDRIQVKAVQGVSFSIEPGELVGFLGPNGAGKTTTLKMLSGILIPSGGEARVLGYKPFDRNYDMLKRISLVMGNKQQLWWDLPARDSYAVLKELYEIPQALYKQRLDELLEILELKDKVDIQVRRLSLGERMKCELVAALLHRPEVLFLDEPTLGLDVVSQKRIREFLRGIHQEEGTTMILTSHYMQDVSELCDRVIIIDKGIVVFDGDLSVLASRFGDSRLIKLQFCEEIDEADLLRIAPSAKLDGVCASLEVSQEETATLAAALLSQLPVADISIEEPDLEEVIRRLFTGHVPRETTGLNS
ncbi:MAG: ATP-binding cassette domain-containing protein [Armatimonadetes bacterium]|nr:ATP-binding cassette domain-containing protein [Armatimonadota bacterium]